MIEKVFCLSPVCRKGCPSMNDHPKTRKLNRLIVWLAGLIAFFVLLAVLLAGFVIREGLTAGDAMRQAPRESPARRLLRPSLATTSSTASAVQAAPAGHVPLLANDAGLSENLKRRRAEINARYAQFLNDLAEFERVKEKLPPEAAWRRFEKLGADFNKVLDPEIAQASFERMANIGSSLKDAFAPGGALEHLGEIEGAFAAWYTLTRIELKERAGEYYMAAALGEHMLLGGQRWEWMQSQGYPNQPIYLSDYYRGPGRQEYQRIIYNYWRAGGTGLLKIVEVALPRYYASVADHFRREKESP